MLGSVDPFMNIIPESPKSMVFVALSLRQRVKGTLWARITQLETVDMIGR
jgi:hypothetical protein